MYLSKAFYSLVKVNKRIGLFNQGVSPAFKTHNFDFRHVFNCADVLDVWSR